MFTRLLALAGVLVLAASSLADPPGLAKEFKVKAVRTNADTNTVTIYWGDHEVTVPARAAWRILYARGKDLGIKTVGEAVKEHIKPGTVVAVKTEKRFGESVIVEVKILGK
jgi:hypothetical protein